jgi:hypothetical protein
MCLQARILTFAIGAVIAAPHRRSPAGVLARDHCDRQ